MSEQDKDALRCADELPKYRTACVCADGAAHIRRLVAEREKDRAVMRFALEALKDTRLAEYIEPQATAISALTERVGE